MSLLSWLFARPTHPESEPGIRIRARIVKDEPDTPYSDPRKEVTSIKLNPGVFDPVDPGGLIWGGFHLHDQDGHRLSHRDDRLKEMGLFIFNVAGSAHRLDALQDSCFTPPKPVRLVAENNNQYDSNAVAIYSEDSRVQAGYVPREFAPDIRAAMAENPNSSAMIIAECYKRKRRVSLTVMFGSLKVQRTT